MSGFWADDSESDSRNECDCFVNIDGSDRISDREEDKQNQMVEDTFEEWESNQTEFRYDVQQCLTVSDRVEDVHETTQGWRQSYWNISGSASAKNAIPATNAEWSSEESVLEERHDCSERVPSKRSYRKKSAVEMYYSMKCKNRQGSCNGKGNGAYCEATEEKKKERSLYNAKSKRAMQIIERIRESGIRRRSTLSVKAYGRCSSTEICKQTGSAVRQNDTECYLTDTSKYDAYTDVEISYSEFEEARNVISDVNQSKTSGITLPPNVRLVKREVSTNNDEIIVKEVYKRLPDDISSELEENLHLNEKNNKRMHRKRTSENSELQTKPSKCYRKACASVRVTSVTSKNLESTCKNTRGDGTFSVDCEETLNGRENCQGNFGNKITGHKLIASKSMKKIRSKRQCGSDSSEIGHGNDNFIRRGVQQTLKMKTKGQIQNNIEEHDEGQKELNIKHSLKDLKKSYRRSSDVYGSNGSERSNLKMSAHDNLEAEIEGYSTDVTTDVEEGGHALGGYKSPAVVAKLLKNLKRCTYNNPKIIPSTEYNQIFPASDRASHQLLWNKPYHPARLSKERNRTFTREQLWQIKRDNAILLKKIIKQSRREPKTVNSKTSVLTARDSKAELQYKNSALLVSSASVCRKMRQRKTFIENQTLKKRLDAIAQRKPLYGLK